ncbi:MAG: FIST N-terminal domain-containing protein [Planctomycetota bacterium]
MHVHRSSPITAHGLQTVVGHSDEIDSVDAIHAVIDQCERELAGRQPTAGVLFASVDYDHQALVDAVSRRWPTVPLIGGTTDGEMSKRNGFTRDSVLLTLLTGDGIRVSAGRGLALSTDVPRAVEEALAQIDEREPTLCIALCAPTANSSAIVRELQSRLGEGCVIAGGLTADHREYSRSAEFCRDEVLRDSLTLLVLGGGIRSSVGIGSGWFPVGNAQRVTRSNGHVVQEIDGKPAAEVFRHYWGHLPEDSLGEYPLAVYENGLDAPCVLRAPLGMWGEHGEIRFAGEVREGSFVRLTEVLPEGILSGTRQSVENAIAAYPGEQPELVMLFSCAARKWVLGSQVEQELDLARRALADTRGALTPIVGMYCFGEIAPLPGEVRSSFHNETCITLVLGR